MTRDEKLAYSKGYNAGCRGYWPLHKPPLPPDEIAADIIRTATAMRDAIDNELAMLDEDDRWQESLGNPLDEFDRAMMRLGEWLKDIRVGGVKDSTAEF